MRNAEQNTQAKVTGAQSEQVQQEREWREQRHRQQCRRLTTLDLLSQYDTFRLLAHWCSFFDLLWADREMEMIDWYHHYLKRHFSSENGDIESAFVHFVASQLRPRARVLECGLGLGRSAAALAGRGFFVLGADNDPNMLRLVRELHAELVTKGQMALLEVDILYLSRFFSRGSFDACTHTGVLEHYEKDQRRLLLLEQLAVADHVLFSVPIDTPHTRAYFERGPALRRDLRSPESWLSELSETFDCLPGPVARQRTDNAFFFIRNSL